jgi:hypothetical protein
MVQTYFLTYETTQTEKPYKLPSELKEQLGEIDGLRITGDHENVAEPVIIIEIPEDRVEQVESLESVVKLDADIEFQLS